MNIAEKIYYTWIALLLPFALCSFIIDKDEHPKLFNAIAMFLIVPIALLFVLTIVSAVYWIWK